MFSEVPDAANVFRGLLQVDPRRDTGLIEISISGTDPNEITQWVNAVSDAYVARNYERAQENVKESVNAIAKQLDDLKRNLSEAERQRFGALENQKIYNSDNQAEIVRQKLKDYNAELTNIQIERNRAAQTLNQIEALRNTGGDMMSLPELAEDPTLKELLRSRIELQRNLESAKVELKPSHPSYEATRNELSTVNERIRERVDLKLRTLENRLDVLRQQEEFLWSQIREQEELSLEVLKATSFVDIVETDAATKRNVLDLISKAMNEVQLGAQLMSNNVAVLDYATPPLFPIKPRRKLNVMVGALFGLFIGIAAAFFMDYLDNSFRTPEDIEKHLGLSVLGVIPRIQNNEGLANRAVREAYQSLRTSVIFSSKNRQRKLILTTSTGPQEGKSSTVANLARTLAQSGDRVVVVDCDLRRPTQHLVHGTEREPGLTNYLAAPQEETDWQGYYRAVGPSNLHVFTCGPIPPSPPELLESERFVNLLKTLRENYDWILMDSPPSASLADSTLLASQADMVVLVVQYNRTDRDQVAKAVQRLRSVNAQIAGSVLNNVDIESAYHKDYYYAGYYYYSEDDKKKPRKRERRVEPRAKVG
jgi:capsular exopolysaccharide synthesis family protein